MVLFPLNNYVQQKYLTVIYDENLVFIHNFNEYLYLSEYCTWSYMLSVRNTNNIIIIIIDGMSITYDTNPHTHIWLYACGYRPVTLPIWAVSLCNSVLISNQSSPSFVGNDYYCESGAQVGVSGRTI